ncbi:dephospho-CoA kinase [Candidatus Pseudoruminococcus sp.]|uniref:dephospho-CoA kinase n=1 Tax=Candidatus Pseudoruminococcus sp. TaxID=3101048 RepID=UPI00399A3D65
MKKIVIGLTGQTGAGKSTVSDAMKKCGCGIIDADKIAREVVEPKTDCLKMLTNAFGCDIINKDGSLNRKKLAEKAFSSKENTKLLNEITHPHIVELTKQRIAEYFANGCEIVVFDAPQLFESGSDKLCDIIVSVIASQECRLQRIISRDSISREQALSRMKVQLSEEYFREHSDYILNGEQSINDLISDAEAFVKIVKDGGFTHKKGSGR